MKAANKASTKRGATPRRRRGRRLARGALRQAEHALATVGLLFLVYHAGFDVSVMVSPSMSPTLQGTSAEDGDRVLTERISYRLRGPRRWELVAFRNRNGERVMKRVVGLPGETVSVQDGEVVVDGSALPRPTALKELKYYAYGNLHRGKSVACEDGYYVMGDDSKDSQDSRYEGPVNPDKIMGRPWLIVWPPERLGFVNP